MVKIILQENTLGFDEFLQLVSPRRAQFRSFQSNQKQQRQIKVLTSRTLVRDARHRYAWNLYNKYQTQVARFGRKMGFTEESLQIHVQQFESVDEDGSGEMELDELMVLFRSIGKNNITREQAQHDVDPLCSIPFYRCKSLISVSLVEIVIQPM